MDKPKLKRQIRIAEPLPVRLVDIMEQSIDLHMVILEIITATYVTVLTIPIK
jgi:hypothetical protein